MIPAKIASHGDEAAALLTERYRGKLGVEGVLRALVKPYDALETAVWDTLEGRVLGAPGCTGVWLDAIGKLVDESRDGRSDAEYEPAIRVRVRVNRSQGRAIDVIEVAKLLDPTATYAEFPPLAWEVDIYNTTLGGHFVQLLAQTKATTSYGVLVTSSWPVADVSKFTDALGPTLLDDTFESAI